MAFHILGDQDTVLGYRFAGVTGTVVENDIDARRAFAEVRKSGQARVLLLTERVEQWLEDAVTEHRLSAEPPFVVVIEELGGPVGHRKTAEQLIYEAVGIRIVKENDATDASG